MSANRTDDSREDSQEDFLGGSPDQPQDPSQGAQQTIRLDQFLKFAGAVGTGGQAKLLIQGGQVLVNGQQELRRRRQLHHGDLVVLDGNTYLVQLDGASY